MREEFISKAWEYYSSWKEKRLTPTFGRNGEVSFKKSNDNIPKVLTYHPLLRGKIAYNKFTQTPCWIELPPLPFSEERESEFCKNGFIEIEETDLTWLNSFFSQHMGWNISSEKIAEYIKAIAMVKPFHPLRDYLESLQWDGTPRIDSWLSDYLGAENNRYHQLVGRFFLLSAVARLFEPGCKQDLIFILEGEQGKKKSTALRILAGEQYFTDTPIELEKKDFYLQLRGKWIIEIAELDALLRSDSSRVKAILSSKVDRYRPPYARKAIDVPRSCIFTGTSNIYEYIKDPTGGRRFIPIRVGNIDLERLQTDREQLWAEAVYRYLTDEELGRYYPLPEEYKILTLVQELRETVDPWLEEISQWLDDRGLTETTTSEVLTQCLGLAPKDFQRSHQIRIGLLLLNKLGWKKKRTARGMIYYKPKKGGAPDGGNSTNPMKCLQSVQSLNEDFSWAINVQNINKNVMNVNQPEDPEQIKKLDYKNQQKETQKQNNKFPTPITHITHITHITQKLIYKRRKREIEKLLKWGFNLIPLKEKQPIGVWKKENYPNITEHEGNIGLKCGETRRKWKLVVIDVDEAELAKKLEDAGLLPPTAKVQTGRGYHYYYSYYGEKTKTRNLRNYGVDIEIRGEGSYVVAPPSIHPSGSPYRWVTPLTLITELPEWAEKYMLYPPKRKKAVVDEDAKQYGDRLKIENRRSYTTYKGRTLNLDELREKILERYEEEVSRAGNGTRNDTLNRWTYLIAGLAGRFNLTESEVYYRALSACKQNGLISDDGQRSFEATFRSAWESGILRPLDGLPGWVYEFKEELTKRKNGKKTTPSNGGEKDKNNPKKGNRKNGQDSRNQSKRAVQTRQTENQEKEETNREDGKHTPQRGEKFPPSKDGKKGENPTYLKVEGESKSSEHSNYSEAPRPPVDSESGDKLRASDGESTESRGEGSKPPKESDSSESLPPEGGEGYQPLLLPEVRERDWIEEFYFRAPKFR